MLKVNELKKRQNFTEDKLKLRFYEKKAPEKSGAFLSCNAAAIPKNLYKVLLVFTEVLQTSTKAHKQRISLRVLQLLNIFRILMCVYFHSVCFRNLS